MVAKVTVDARGAFQKLMKEQRRILKAGKATTEELVNLGVSYAKQHVPKSGAATVFKCIKGKTKETNNGSSGEVYIQDKTMSDGPHRTTHDVAYFMAKGLSGRSNMGYAHFKTGNPKFMDNTRVYLNKIKKQIGNKRIKRKSTPTSNSV